MANYSNNHLKVTAMHCQQILAAKIPSDSNYTECVPTSQEPEEAVPAILPDAFYVLCTVCDQDLEGKAQDWLALCLI